MAENCDTQASNSIAITWRFDPVDITQMRLLAKLPPGRRVAVMLQAQALVRGIIMGRLRRQYPNLSSRELALKLLEEVSRARPAPRF
jgi:hypothetical protein